MYKLKYKRRITRVYVEGEKVIQKRVFILVCILLHVGEAQSSVKTRHNEKQSQIEIKAHKSYLKLGVAKKLIRTFHCLWAFMLWPAN